MEDVGDPCARFDHHYDLTLKRHCTILERRVIIDENLEKIGPESQFKGYKIIFWVTSWDLLVK